MTCTSGCRTKNHESYGDCLKAKAVRTYLASPSKGLDGTRQKRWSADLAAYRDAVRQGIQPDSTNRASVEKAVRRSDETGAAYGRDFNAATSMEG
ncbi:hypothetical protein [Streptomyces johnsoniae]|uniref:Uncharacterized protein n=1 Tax=Streptomyces johnsoniae TaxID=3075532 RepID=A0ABU2S0M1_9ACTN|nr:hypothetical protein [Streptomyces sp. DSM 41886]MDT0442323.1 hypothetical protein [Streptomyces sp. DSM 41886]